MPELTTADYCRQIEQYLCRRNGGHLIRIVGPAFEKVTAWAGRGIPLRVAFRGIDRHVDREDAKGPRRRPVRIEFCEADVLDVFDEWRRAIGAETGGALDGTPVAAAGGAEAEPAGTRPRRVALQAHVDRVMARLTQRRLDADLPTDLAEAIEQALQALDAVRGPAHGARGEQRDALHARLREIEATLVARARAATPGAQLARLDAEARRELEEFRGRMRADVFERAVSEASTRQLRESLRLPDIAAGT